MSDSATAPTLESTEHPPAWRGWLLCAALLPFSFNIGYYLHPKKFPFYVAPLDLLVGPLALYLLYKLMRGGLKDWLPPLGNLFWAIVALASIVWSEPRAVGEWAKSAVGQTALAMLAAVWVVRHLAPDTVWLRRAALALGAATAACVLYALYQYVQPVGLPLPTLETDRYFGGGVTNVRLAGWFSFRGQFAAQLAMLIPACVAFATFEKDSALRVGAGALAALGVCVCMFGGGVLAACAGTLAVAALLITLKTARPFSAAAIASGLLIVVVLVVPRLPRDNPQVLLRTLSLYTPAGSEGGPLPTARLRRYQAAVNAMSDGNAWLAGAGAGKFQSTVNQYYSPSAYPKPSSNTDDEAAFDVNAHEPMTYGLLETTAVELGALGLIGMALVFVTWLAAAISAYVRTSDGDAAARALALASAGACVGAAVFSIFGSPLVRGCAGTFAFFMGSALYLHARASKES